MAIVTSYKNGSLGMDHPNAYINFRVNGAPKLDYNKFQFINGRADVYASKEAFKSKQAPIFSREIQFYHDGKGRESFYAHAYKCVKFDPNFSGYINDL